jgi:hypothetical protein
MFRFFAAVLICGSFLVAAPAVSADGATVIDEDYACDTDFGITICSSLRVVRHTAVQADGDESYMAHTDETVDMYGPTGLLLSTSSSEDFHYITIDELFQEMHLRMSNTLVIPMPALSCQTESFFHLANNRIQFDRYEVNCDPPL